MSTFSKPSRLVLDRPVWHALTGRQSSIALRAGDARRLAPPYGPFAAAADPAGDVSGDLASLAHLSDDVALWLVETAAVVAPPGLVVTRRAECVQMVATAIVPGGRDHGFVDLGNDDGAEMLALATLTAPGPFAAQTHRLGRFVGVRSGGRLVAMAGERLKPGDHTELSGVCTHPDHRGRGYAGFLMRVVAARILARGEHPFLHCYAANHGAIALYESLGFEVHQTITATVLTPG